MTSGIASWYVVHSHPNGESKAAFHLERQGFGTYLPQYLKRRRHARRTEIVSAPLFPRYLFVEVKSETQRWQAIYSTVGVSRIVCANGLPLAIDRQILLSLRARENGAGFVAFDVGPNFRVGEKVRITDGAFADCLGLYEGISSNERVSLLLDLLGRKVRVAVDTEAIAAA